MFTGLVEEVGIINNHINTKDGIEIEINADIIMEDLKVKSNHHMELKLLKETLKEKLSFIH